MAPRTTLLIVEGPQDSAVISRLFVSRGYVVVRQHRDLPAALDGLVPRSFPVRGDLLARHPVPTFLGARTTDSYLAVVTAGSSWENIAVTLCDRLKSLRDTPGAIGVLFDADEEAPSRRYLRFKERLGLHAESAGVPTPSFPDVPGMVKLENTPRTGVFIAPNNRDRGTLEDLLVEAAEANYPCQWNHAVRYVRDRPVTGLDDADQQEISKPAGATKAALHALACLLKPGKAIQNSISDNRWFENASRQQPQAMELLRFLSELVL